MVIVGKSIGDKVMVVDQKIKRLIVVILGEKELIGRERLLEQKS